MPTSRPGLTQPASPPILSDWCRSGPAIGSPGIGRRSQPATRSHDRAGRRSRSSRSCIRPAFRTQGHKASAAATWSPACRERTYPFCVSLPRPMPESRSTGPPGRCSSRSRRTFWRNHVIDPIYPARSAIAVAVMSGVLPSSYRTAVGTVNGLVIFWLIVDPAGRDPVEIGLLDPRMQRPVDPPASFQRRREERPDRTSGSEPRRRRWSWSPSSAGVRYGCTVRPSPHSCRPGPIAAFASASIDSCNPAWSTPANTARTPS